MLLRLSVRNLDISETVLFWEAEPEAREDISKFGYIIEVSESVEGPWDQLFGDPIYAYGFIDRTTQRGMIDQRVYYRVHAINLNGKEFYSDPVLSVEGDRDYISQYVIKQESLLLRRFIGKDVLHYARRKFGKRCPVCYSDTERKVIRPNCKICFGTTYENGYFAPVKIIAHIEPQDKVLTKHEMGVSENTVTSGWASMEVILSPDDLLVVLQNPLERYIVQQLKVTEHAGTTIRQIYSLEQLRSDHPGMKVPVIANVYNLNEFNVFRREWMIRK